MDSSCLKNRDTNQMHDVSDLLAKDLAKRFLEKEQEKDVSDLLAKDLEKRLIKRDHQNKEIDSNTEKLTKQKKKTDLNNLNKKTADELIENTLQELESLNNLLNHALDKTLGLNEIKTPLNLIESTNCKRKQSTELNKEDKQNDSLEFKVPRSPKRLKVKLKSSNKDPLTTATTQQIKKDLEEDLEEGECKKHKKKKKKKDEKHVHRCKKHRKKTPSTEIEDLNLKKHHHSDTTTNQSTTPSSSSREKQYYEDDFKDYREEEDKYYYSSRKSTRNYYESLSPTRYSDDYYDKYSYKDKYRYNDKQDYDFRSSVSSDKYKENDKFNMKKLRNENSITNWTKFCRKIQKDDEFYSDDDHSSIESRDFYSDDDDKQSIISERFINRESLKSKEIKFEIRDFKSRQARSAIDIKKELMDQFPVSSGVKHQWKDVDPLKKDQDKKEESTKQKSNKSTKEKELEDKVDDFLNKHVNNEENSKNGFDIGSIMSQRLAALKILATDASNLTALNQLMQADSLINEWSLSKSNKEIEEKQAEVSSSFQTYSDFTKAAKSKDGIGMALLQKMGWQPGQGLGKNNEGLIEPLIPELKLDTKGLITDEEKCKKNNVQSMYNIPQIDNVNTSKIANQNKTINNQQPIANSCEQLTKIANQSIVNGKHPVNILQEVCSKKRWKQANYTIVNENGPAHKKNFLVKCTLNNVDYLPSFTSPNKKLAKAISAIVCLQAFGLIDYDELG